MANKIGLTVFTAGLLFATVVFAPYALSAAQGRLATSTDFSAQQQQDNKGKQKKAAPAARPGPQRAAPQRAAPQRAAPQRATPQRSAPREAARRRRLRARLRRNGWHQARLLGKNPSRTWSGSRRPLRKWPLRSPPVDRPLPLRASLHHAAPEPSLQRACAGCRGAARAALSSAAKITRRGAADTGYVTAAAGGRS